MSTLNFLPTAGNPRIDVIRDIDRLMRTDMEPREALLAILGAIRRAYQQQVCYVEANTTALPPGCFRITHVWREDGVEAVPNNSPWIWQNVPVRTGGFMPQIFARQAPSLLHDLQIDPQDPMYPELSTYHSAAASPGAFGDPDNWVVVLRHEPDGFDIEFLENMVMRLGLISTALKNLQALGDLRRANAFIDAEVGRIADIQRALLPESTPQIPRLDFAAISQTFARAGGDLYDAVEIPEGKWVLLIADASGHGPSAAVVAAMLHAILHTYPETLDHDVTALNPSHPMTYANTQLADTRIEHSFVTAILAIWDPAKLTFTYSRAGHNPPMLRRGNQVTELNQVGNIPLAVLPETKYESYTQQLQPGDVLILFTDGITEARDEAGDQFGEDRLKSALLAAHGSASEILDSLMTALQCHTLKVRSRDDQTLLVLCAK
ncbi:MAG: PP2C family protein-serine/threonine phosphatase [Tepidisphaeraceae bacterium]|jgi:sigma-B regulation protein RsbU (phosphoserine phosphatase)